MKEALRRPHAPNLQSATNLTFSPICHHPLCSCVTPKYNYTDAAGPRRRPLWLSSAGRFLDVTFKNPPQHGRQENPGGAASTHQAQTLHLCSMKEARGSTQAVTAPMAKRARAAGSGWESTAWTTSRTSVYLSRRAAIRHQQPPPAAEAAASSSPTAPLSHPGGSTSRRLLPPSSLRLSRRSDRNRCRCGAEKPAEVPGRGGYTASLRAKAPLAPLSASGSHRNVFEKEYLNQKNQSPFTLLSGLQQEIAEFLTMTSW